MSSSIDFIEYVCEQLYDYKPTFKKMFGEYMIYVECKPILLVCDNTVYVKQLEEVKDILCKSEKGFPYPNAKECYIIDIDNRELLEKLIPVLVSVIPVPVKKRKA